MRKLFKILIFLLVSLTVISSNSFGEVIYYGIDVDIQENGNSLVHMVLTCKNISKISFLVFGRIENFKTQNFLKCDVKKGDVSLVECYLPNQNVSTYEIFYETKGFVKNVEKKRFFFADLSLINQTISYAFLNVKLPLGYVLSEKLEGVRILSDGKRILIAKSFENSDEISLKFFFESISLSIFQKISISYIFVLVIVSIVVAFLSYLFYSKRTKEEKDYLTLLDKDEKKVLEIILREKEIIQRKIVSSTNLSKTKVSRIISRLKERGIIEVEKRGRTNLIKLKKK